MTYCVDRTHIGEACASEPRSPWMLLLNPVATQAFQHVMTDPPLQIAVNNDYGMMTCLWWAFN